jgi:ankyrin repeat protein
MKNKNAGAGKYLGLFCVPLIPLVALPVVQRVQALAAEKKQADAAKSRDARRKSATQQLLAEVGDSQPARVAWVELLLSNGADVNALYKNSESALDGASVLVVATQQQAPPEVVQVLLESGADVNAQDKIGSTALINAAQWGDIKTVRLLLNAKASINLRMTAHEHRHTALSAVRCMMRSTDKDWPSKTAVQNYPQIIKMLKAAGAKE